MQLISAAQTQIAAGFTNKDIKRELSQHFNALPRRLDRNAWQMLLACAPLKNKVHSQCGIYIAASYPAADTMTSLLNTVCVSQLQPKPFEFVNSVSNAAGFYVAQQLGLEGPNLFISQSDTTWSQLISLAQADQCPQAMLLCCDNPDDSLIQVVLLERSEQSLAASNSFAKLTQTISVQRFTYA